MQKYLLIIYIPIVFILGFAFARNHYIQEFINFIINTIKHVQKFNPDDSCKDITVEFCDDVRDSFPKMFGDFTQALA